MTCRLQLILWDPQNYSDLRKLVDVAEALGFPDSAAVQPDRSINDKHNGQIRISMALYSANDANDVAAVLNPPPATTSTGQDPA